MTITKETPVTPSGAALKSLERLSTSGVIRLDLPRPPRFLDEWLDLDAYEAATSTERFDLALAALEREIRAKGHFPGAKTPKRLPASVMAAIGDTSNVNRRETP